MNLALWRIWKHLPEVKLLAQVHDAVYFNYLEEHENHILPAALDLIDIRLTHNERQLIVPGECKIGYNWGNYATEEDVEKGRASRVNLSGLKKWKPIITH
jgi:hypothetical protein